VCVCVCECVCVCVCVCVQNAVLEDGAGVMPHRPPSVQV
jgi:hypothetical protein